jgi:hypothetical protein
MVYNMITGLKGDIATQKSVVDALKDKVIKALHASIIAQKELEDSLEYVDDTVKCDILKAKADKSHQLDPNTVANAPTAVMNLLDNVRHPETDIISMMEKLTNAENALKGLEKQLGVVEDEQQVLLVHTPSTVHKRTVIKTT